MLTLDTGIRSQEAFSLLESDINLKNYTVDVRAEIAKTRPLRSWGWCKLALADIIDLRGGLIWKKRLSKFSKN